MAGLDPAIRAEVMAERLAGGMELADGEEGEEGGSGAPEDLQAVGARGVEGGGKGREEGMEGGGEGAGR